MTALNPAIERQVKQGIIDAQAGDTVTVKFENNSMTCHLLASCGGYFIIYDSTADRLIVAWSLRLANDSINNKVIGDWGNGYYFDNNGGNDIVTRYDIKEVVKLFIEKSLGWKE